MNYRRATFAACIQWGASRTVEKEAATVRLPQGYAYGVSFADGSQILGQSMFSGLTTGFEEIEAPDFWIGEP